MIEGREDEGPWGNWANGDCSSFLALYLWRTLHGKTSGDARDIHRPRVTHMLPQVSVTSHRPNSQHVTFNDIIFTAVPYKRPSCWATDCLPTVTLVFCRAFTYPRRTARTLPGLSQNVLFLPSLLDLLLLPISIHLSTSILLSYYPASFSISTGLLHCT